MCCLYLVNYSLRLDLNFYLMRHLRLIINCIFGLGRFRAYWLPHRGAQSSCYHLIEDYFDE